MTRVSGNVVPIPDKVNVNLTESEIEIKGPNGKVIYPLNKNVTLKSENSQILILNKDESKQTKAVSGTYRSLLSNMIHGVTVGYEKKLIVVGVGYKVSVNANVLNMNIGYSHPINYKAPEGISIISSTPTEILIRGVDKQKVGQTAADIRAFRKPEPYKGKGIRYENEIIVLKETKKIDK